MARQKKVVEENPAPKKRGRKVKAEEIPVAAPVMEKPVEMEPVKKAPGRKKTVVKEEPKINVVKLIEESATLKAENTQLKAEIVRLKKAIADLA